jgi:cytochrome c oxidase subunit 2
MWFEATTPGVYPIFCAEYCGDQHSSMIGKVHVVPREEYQAKLDEAARLVQDEGESMVDFGKRVWDRGGCASCHSLDGTTKTGPSLKGKYGTNETLVDGSTIAIDDNYIRESILEPNAKVVQGFTPQMPSFAGRFDDKAIAGLIEFIKSNK